MTSVSDVFDRKLLADPAEIVQLIPHHSRVVLGHAAGEPTLLVEAMMAGVQSLKGVEIVHMVPLGECLYCQPGLERHVTHNSIFVGAPTRQAVNDGRADFTPVFFSEVPRLIREKRMPVDVAMITVSPPDEEGWMSYGVSVDYTEAASKHARLVVAEVNQLMPRTHGARIHISEIDHFVRSERPLPELRPGPIGPIEAQIGSHISSLIKDGDCLQLGIGSIPDAVLRSLHDKRDLGIHTEMFSDGVIDLVEGGIITNRRKKIAPGKMVATFLMGTRKLYDFVHDNPDIWMQPVDMTNNIMVAGCLENLISINSAIQVDLQGQICADMIGPLQFSSVGGQVDFVRAAAASPGGRSIIALPATAKNGTISRIVPHLDPGASVTTSRFDVDTVVTEYGIAELKGRTLRQRRDALIAIAHPDFRDLLRDQGLRSSVAS